MTKAAESLMILCLMTLLSGCATDSPQKVVCEIETVYQDRYIGVDPRLTQPVEIVELPAEGVDTIDLGVAYKAQRTRAEQCNGQLAEIAKLPVPEKD